MKKRSFFLLRFFVLLCGTGVGWAGLPSCPTGGCDWMDPAKCLAPTGIDVVDCVDPDSQCMVAIRSLNSSDPWDNTLRDQLYQCSCKSGNSRCDSSASNSADTTCARSNPAFNLTAQAPGNVMQVSYASLWKCDDNSRINCPANNDLSTIPGSNSCQVKILPNAYSLIRYWCQNKPRCEFNMEIVLTYVYPNVSPIPTAPDSVFEWRKADVVSNSLSCGRNQVLRGDSCYRVTYRGISWADARRQCMDLGGDLARFSSYTDFHEILVELDPFTLNNTGIIVPVWFKWYSWTGEQRSVQYFNETVSGFWCNVIQKEYQDGKNPLAVCTGRKPPQHVRGLCVLPPVDDMKRDYRVSYCPAQDLVMFDIPLSFPETRADEIAVEMCPQGFNGTMYWTCGITGEWVGKPDISSCVTADIETEAKKAQGQIHDGIDPAEVIGNLTEFIRKYILYPGDINILDDTLAVALEAEGELLDNLTKDATKENQAKNFTRVTADYANECLNSTVGFLGFDYYKRCVAVNNWQKHIDETLFQLAANLMGETPYRQDYINIVMEVEPGKPLPSEVDNYVNTTATFFINNTNQDQSITLPSGYAYALDENQTATRLSFVAMIPMIRNLYGDAWLDWDTKWVNETHNGTCKESSAQPLKSVLNTAMLGSTLGEPGVSVQFPEDGNGVIVRLKKKSGRNYTTNNERCVFWDPLRLDWSDKGCVLLSTNAEYTECRCDHLTNFAVIMDVNGVFNTKDVEALDWITMIGLIISVVALALALFVFVWVRNLRKEFRFHIHRNLCFCLLVAELLMLFGLDAPGKSEDGCLTIAVFLHFFLLCCFTWMLVEGLYLYFLITKVFDGSGFKRYQYYLIGYGVPVVIVSITLGATNLDGYITRAFNKDTCNEDLRFCWLNNDRGALWAFVAPVALVILLNIVFLTVALTAAFKARRRNPNAASHAANNANKEAGANLQWLFGAISLNFLLGITWIYGFFIFADDAASLVMAYIFTVLNSLQGLVIFMTLVVLNKEVRTHLHRQFISNEFVQRMAQCLNIDVAEMTSGWSTKNRSATVSHRIMKNSTMKSTNTISHAVSKRSEGLVSNDFTSDSGHVSSPSSSSPDVSHHHYEQDKTKLA